MELPDHRVREICEEFSAPAVTAGPAGHGPAVGERVHPNIELSDLEASLGDLVLPEGLLARIVAALRSDHLRLIGPPGSGKSTIAQAILEAAMGDYHIFAAATKQWRNDNVIGGPVPDEADPNHLVFRPGILLDAANEGRWVGVDEVNRADIDDAFGELFSLLAGFDTHLPFFADAESERRVKIYAVRPEGELETGEYGLYRDWRMVATMNSWDKASLSRTSFAFSRRWCTVFIPVPSPEEFGDILDGFLKRWSDADSLPLRNALEFTFVLNEAEQGPTLRSLGWGFGPGVVLSCVRDIASMVSIGIAPEIAFCRSLEGFVYPQFEGALESHESLAASLEIAMKLAGSTDTLRAESLERLGTFTGAFEEDRYT